MKTYKRTGYLAGEVVKLVDNLGKNAVVCDIATDHGYIAEEISKNSKVKKVIATDISKKSLSKLEKLILKNNLKKIETRLGDGLNPIEKADVAVIAGIGGWEIIKMISEQNTLDKNRKIDLFVLQPTQNFIDLRRFLFENDIFVISDKIIKDENRYYIVLVIDVSKKQRNEKNIFNLWLGRDNDINDSDFRDYLIDIQKFLVFLNSIPKEKIEQDDDLQEKYNLKILVDKLLS